MSLDLLNKSVAATELLSQRPENAELLSKIMNWDFTKVENRYCKEFRQACIQHFGEVNVFVEAVVCCM